MGEEGDAPRHPRLRYRPMVRGDAGQQGNDPEHGERPEHSPHVGDPGVEVVLLTMREEETTTGASTEKSQKGAEGQTTRRSRLREEESSRGGGRRGASRQKDDTQTRLEGAGGLDRSCRGGSWPQQVVGLGRALHTTGNRKHEGKGRRVQQSPAHHGAQ